VSDEDLDLDEELEEDDEVEVLVAGRSEATGGDSRRRLENKLEEIRLRKQMQDYDFL
tara:strand:+ start:233 stop:403 length:171 start_codon:yes stop_codon:yes gene_type:complete